MEASAKMEGKMRFVGTADSGHKVVLDADQDAGGDDDGFGPMELVLIGLCACTAMDAISILRKKRQHVSDLEVKANAERSEEHPKIFTSVALEYIVTGTEINPAAVERAIQLSTERYCPVHAMLGEAAEISTSYQIIDESDR